MMSRSILFVGRELVLLILRSKPAVGKRETANVKGCPIFRMLDFFRQSAVGSLNRETANVKRERAADIRDA